MQRNELAALLDISPSMVSRLAKRGMPTDDLERARRWRKRHLHPGRVKGARFAPDRIPVSSVDVDPADRELDMVDAFECLAVAARIRGGGEYVAALAHLFLLMSDAHRLRAEESSEVHPDLWPLIEKRLDEFFSTPFEGATP
jgi:hypothetical protein